MDIAFEFIDPEIKLNNADSSKAILTTANIKERSCLLVKVVTLDALVYSI